MNIYYIYFYTRVDGAPYYVGRGKNNRAYTKHFRSNGFNFTPKNKDQIKIIFNNLSKKQSIDLEKYYIKCYGRKEFDGILINIKEGGEDLKDWTPEMRKRMSIQQTGKKHADSTKLKMSIAHKGKKLDPKSVQKMVETRHKLGNYKQSLETRQKLSLSHLGLFTGSKNPAARAVDVYTKDGDFIKTFSTGREAAKFLKLGNSWKHIPECCKGKRKFVKGYKFLYS